MQLSGRRLIYTPVLAALCAGVWFVSPSAQQQDRPSTNQPSATFRTEANYVDIDAVVTDEQGNFVRSLTKDDFEVFEDGKPQKVEMFSFVDLPVLRAPELERPSFGEPGPVVVSDVKSNEHALTGRLYVIVMDDLDTNVFRQDIVKKTARRFIEKNLQPNDMAAVVYTSGRVDAQQDFTNEPALLLAAVDKFTGRKLRSYTLDKIDTYFSQLITRQQMQNDAHSQGWDPNSGPMPGTNTGSESSGSLTGPLNPNSRGDGYPDYTGDAEDFERADRAIGVLNTLRDLADFVTPVRGRRKALLLFSEGIDYETTNIFGARNQGQVITAMRDAITAAARGNVTIYGVDPRGLVGMTAEAVGELQMAPNPADPLSMGANLQAFTAEMRLSQDSLKTLSEETGGSASVGANDVGPFLDWLVKANSTYYLLGYRSPNRPRDGRFHKIEVRVKKPGLKVNARKGYAEGPGKAAEARAKKDRENAEKIAKDLKKGKKVLVDETTGDLHAALTSPMQQDGLPMMVHASAFKISEKENTVALALEIDASELRFEPQQNRTVFADTLELSYFGVNEEGKSLQGQHKEVQLALRPDTYEAARKRGVRINDRLTLAPGRYQLRVGIRDAGTGSIGTVFYDLQVPDFTREGLSMSGLLLTASSSPMTPTLVADTLIGPEQLPGPATSRRTFSSNDELVLYGEIYDNVRGENSVAVTTRLIADDGREAFASRETRSTHGLTGPVTFEHSKRIPLKGVSPGRYLLRVEVQQASGHDDRRVTRETMLTVVPGNVDQVAHDESTR